MQDYGTFAAGLLRPDAPVPETVKGQSARRYGVYRNNVTVGLIAALEANFPAVRQLLGETYFAGFAREFAQKNPPSSPLLFEYGADFSTALAEADDLADYPYLADVAHMEILWRQSFHAADAAVLAADALAVIAPEQLFDCMFTAHPALRLLTSPFAVTSIFLSNRGNTKTPAIDPAHAQSAMITRPLLDVLVHPITGDQYMFLKDLADGIALGDAASRAADEHEQFDLPGSLTLLLMAGAFQTVTTQQD